MSWRFVALGMLLLVHGGCVRAGFSLDSSSSDGATSGEVGSPAADGPAASSGTVTQQHDTCANPYPLDLQQLPVTVTVNPAGANDDYLHCEGQPDLVLRYINSPGMVRVTCASSGRVTLWLGFDPMSCPAQAMATHSMGCMNNFQGINLAVGTGHLFLCRDPADGPATVTFLPL